MSLIEAVNSIEDNLFNLSACGISDETDGATAEQLARDKARMCALGPLLAEANTRVAALREYSSLPKVSKSRHQLVTSSYAN